MPTDKPPPVAAAMPSPSLSDLAARINTEFAAIQSRSEGAVETSRGLFEGEKGSGVTENQTQGSKS
jgi:hypothetical protein